MGLLAGDTAVVAACAGDAVRGLASSHDNRAAVALGERALALIDAGGQPAPLPLLLVMTDVLDTLGEVALVDTLLTRADTVLDQGSFLAQSTRVLAEDEV